MYSIALLLDPRFMNLRFMSDAEKNTIVHAATQEWNDELKHKAAIVPQPRPAAQKDKRNRLTSLFPVELMRLKLHGIKRPKMPQIRSIKKHKKIHSLACIKPSRFRNTKKYSHISNFHP